MREFNFNPCVITLDELAQEAEEVVGPSVAVVGWIPYYPDVEKMPGCEYKSHPLLCSKMRPTALSVLFGSGNETKVGSNSNPNTDGFGGQTGLLELVASKNYRAALALDEVKLRLTHDGRPVTLSFMLLNAVGFTPIRVSGFVYYDKGDGVYPPYRIEKLERDAVTLRCEMLFRIGKLGQIGSLFLTGKRAPFASMMLDYRIDSGGHGSVEFHGSYIPSQSCFLNWQREHLHDMMVNKLDEINGFFNAGTGPSAPRKLHTERVFG